MSVCHCSVSLTGHAADRMRFWPRISNMPDKCSRILHQKLASKIWSNFMQVSAVRNILKKQLCGLIGRLCFESFWYQKRAWTCIKFLMQETLHKFLSFCYQFLKCVSPRLICSTTKHSKQSSTCSWLSSAHGSAPSEKSSHSTTAYIQQSLACEKTDDSADSGAYL